MHPKRPTRLLGMEEHLGGTLLVLSGGPMLVSGGAFFLAILLF